MSDINECTPTVDTGLRNVVVASTKISDVDGARGRLVYRGYLAKDLAGKASFEELVYLLLFEKLPTKEEFAAFDARLKEQRGIPQALVDALETRPADALPMDILQSSISMLAHHDQDVHENDHEAVLRMAIKLVAKTATIIAAWERIRNGKAPLLPEPELSHAANFLYMLTGEVPDEEVAGFFDTCLVLHAEHSLNASTFAAREVASTRAHIYSAIAAAVGSLSGELHGGANTRVMQMLKKVGSVDAVEDYVNSELAAGRKVMGLGHAVYKVDDPRALILAPMSKVMGEKRGDSRWYEISKALEEAGKRIFKEKKKIDIFVNVDFYSASLYYSMGIPMDMFTPVFALSRVSGWAAHVLEEQFSQAAPKAVLYRPESNYVGEYCGPDVCTYEDIDDR